MSIVSILCVPVGGAVLRFVSVLYSLMVEKVERLLRGQWSAFNIYGASRCASRGGVSSSRLVFLLVPRLVSRLVHRLICASCSSVSLLRSVSFVSFRFVSSLRIVSSCISLWRSMSLASRVIFPSRVSFRSSSRCSFRLVLSCRFRGGWRLVWDVGGVGGGDGVLLSSCDVVAVASCFPCSGWLGGGRSIGLRRFIQLVLVRICGCRDLARGKMASI